MKGVTRTVAFLRGPLEHVSVIRNTKSPDVNWVPKRYSLSCRALSKVAQQFAERRANSILQGDNAC